MNSRILLLPLLAMSFPSMAQFTLKEAIAYGKEHSPKLVIAANDRAMADAQAQEAISGYLPQVNGSGQLDDNLKRQTTILPPGIFSGEPTPVQFGTQFSTSLSVYGEQTLIDVTQLNGIQAIKPYGVRADIQVQRVEEQLIYDVARIYAEALSFREQARLLADNLQQYEELVPILQLRDSKGVAQPLDLDRTLVTQRNIRSQHTVAQAQYDIAVDRLKQVIGMPLDKDLELRDSILDPRRIADPRTDGFVLKNLLEYQYSEQTLLLAGIEVKRKRNAFLPSLSAFGRYGTIAQGNDLGDSYDNWYDFAAVGLKLNVPIFSGLRRTSQIKQSELTLSSAREQLKLNSSGWELNYRNADTRLIASETNAINDAENLALAEKLFAMTNVQYQEGLVSLSDLLTVNYQLKEAQNNYTTSLLSNYLAIIELQRAQGTLIQFANAL
jgi:outer membrane protein